MKKNDITGRCGQVKEGCMIKIWRLDIELWRGHLWVWWGLRGLWPYVRADEE